MARIITVSDQNKRANDVSKFIQYNDLFAYKQDIKDWVDSRLLAITTHVPDWTNYIRVLEDIVVDAHISSIITTIKNKVKLKEWAICNADGTENEEVTELLDKEWFYKFMDYVIESIFYPYSLVFLGDMKNWNLDISMIPREYVTPQYEMIKKTLYVSNDSPSAGWKYTDPKLAPYYIFVPSDRQLGLLDVAASHALGKKHMLIYWWRYAEKFGIPFAKGHTDINDDLRRGNMETMLDQMGNSPWGVFDNDDDVTFESPKDVDAYQVFKEQLLYSNNEISKAFAGAIGIFDEKSFVGSAEVGERIFDDYIQSYCVKVTNNSNNELIPRLINTYKFPIPQGAYFKFINREKVSFDQKLQSINTLLPYYSISPEEINNKLGIEVETKAESNIEQVSNLIGKGIANQLPRPNEGETEQEFINRNIISLSNDVENIDRRIFILKQQYRNGTRT